MSKRIINRKYGFFEIIIEFVILIFIIPLMFDLSFFTGIAYLVAFGSSILTGLFLKKRKMARFIVVGSLLGYFAGLLFMDTFKNYENMEPVSLGIMIFVIIIIWYGASLMRKGKKLNIKFFLFN